MHPSENMKNLSGKNQIIWGGLFQSLLINAGMFYVE